MESVERIAQQIMGTSKPKKSITSKAIANTLEANGWLKRIAGEADFNKAVLAIKTAYENNRGIYITGVAGVGKTALLKALHKIYKAEYGQFVYCKEDYKLKWLVEDPFYYYKRNVFIDDLGSEEFDKNYGKTTDIIGDFIQKYYAQGTRNLYLTTNLMANEIRDKYGSRVIDRLLEMCVVIRLNGMSKRKEIVI